MNVQTSIPTGLDQPIREGLRIGGETLQRERVIEVRYPYTGEVIATVPKASIDDVRSSGNVTIRLK